MKTNTTPKKASHQDWHPADVVAALHKRGVTLRKIAAQHGVSGEAVVKALRERNLPSEKRIADAIGIPPQAIWPSRYNPDGSRAHPPKLTRTGRKVNGNIRQAA